MLFSEGEGADNFYSLGLPVVELLSSSSKVAKRNTYYSAERWKGTSHRLIISG